MPGLEVVQGLAVGFGLAVPPAGLGDDFVGFGAEATVGWRRCFGNHIGFNLYDGIPEGIFGSGFYMALVIRCTWFFRPNQSYAVTLSKSRRNKFYGLG